MMNDFVCKQSAQLIYKYILTCMQKKVKQKEKKLKKFFFLDIETKNDR